jgi:hypothetical protein
VDDSLISTSSGLKQPDRLGRPQQIAQAIKNATTQAGSNFADLLHQAAIESGLNPNAKSKTGSAAGLFQFTEQTWLHMVKARGAEYGLGSYADHIMVDSNGKAHVSDPTQRNAILDLRQNPQISTEMKCQLDNENGQKLRESVGGAIGPTELYLAHFLGAGGASSFLNAMRTNPNTKSADILPNAASTNSSVFFGADGEARSVAQIYQHFAQKLDQPLTNVMASRSLTAMASSSAPGQANTEAASRFAMMILEQMNEITSMFAADDEEDGESTISVLV